ncbi:MAG TPA: lytic transglycosylase domain-containing protein [Limnochordales bacterium]
MSKRAGAGRLLWLVLLLVLAAAFMGKPVLRRLFPIPFAPEIAAAAAEHGVDPFLIAALVRVESRFDPHAVSPRGARGLMQVMPDTGQWIAAQLGWAGYDSDWLFDPQTNLRMGAWYLRTLLDQFGEPAIALAAYNAGRARVQEWLAQGRWNGQADTLADIPFAETRNHVQRVLTTLQTYRWLYDGSWRQVSSTGDRM